MILDEIVKYSDGQDVYTACVNYTKNRLDTVIKEEIDSFCHSTGTSMREISLATGASETVFAVNHKRGVVRIAADHIDQVRQLIRPSLSLEEFLWGQEIPTILPRLDQKVLEQIELAPAVPRRRLLMKYSMRNPMVTSALERVMWICSERGSRFPFQTVAKNRSLSLFFSKWQEHGSPLYEGRIEQLAGAALAMKVPLAFMLGLNYANSYLLIQDTDGTYRKLTETEVDYLNRFCMLSPEEKGALLVDLSLLTS